MRYEEGDLEDIEGVNENKLGLFRRIWEEFGSGVRVMMGELEKVMERCEVCGCVY